MGNQNCGKECVALSECFFSSVSQGLNRPSCDYNPESDKLGLVTIADVRERGKRHFSLCFKLFGSIFNK